MKTSIKLVGFISLFILYDTFIKSFLPIFFFANYRVIVTTNFSRCCGWLRFAAQPNDDNNNNNNNDNNDNKDDHDNNDGILINTMKKK